MSRGHPPSDTAGCEMLVTRAARSPRPRTLDFCRLLTSPSPMTRHSRSVSRRVGKSVPAVPPSDDDSFSLLKDASLVKLGVQSVVNTYQWGRRTQVRTKEEAERDGCFYSQPSSSSAPQWRRSATRHAPQCQPQQPTCSSQPQVRDTLLLAALPRLAVCTQAAQTLRSLLLVLAFACARSLLHLQGGGVRATAAC